MTRRDPSIVLPPRVPVEIDPLSRLPYPIILNEVISYEDPEASWHHGIFHSTDARLDNEGGQAAREANVQLTTRRDHNHLVGSRQSFHDAFDGSGPWLPANDDDCLDMIIPGIAGYVSDYGIDLDKPGDWVQPLSPKQKAILELPAKISPPYHRGELRARMSYKAAREYALLENPSVTLRQYTVDALKADGVRQAVYSRHHFSYHYPLVRDFFWKYLLGQDMSHIGETVEEFTGTVNPERQQTLGRKLLEEMVYVATDRVGNAYNEMYNRRSLHPNMPADVGQLVLGKLGGQRHQDHEMRVHAQRLRKAQKALTAA